jgi:hypothetical protein
VVAPRSSMGVKSRTKARIARFAWPVRAAASARKKYEYGVPCEIQRDRRRELRRQRLRRGRAG